MNNILSLADAYKISHKFQYPKDTEIVYVNWTIRSSRLPTDHYIFFGLQYFIKEYLIRRFNAEFFSLPKEQALKQFKRRINNFLGLTDLSHFDELHDLGYLPLVIKALPEGSKIGIRVPCMTMYNTLPQFYWLTNYIETILSTTLWGGIDSATVGHIFAGIRDKYFDLTSTDEIMRMFLLHDFSGRGMFGSEAGAISGGAFLLSSYGSDTIWAVDFLEEYYNANSDKEMVAASIPALEHSVACAGGEDGEENTLIRMITEVYPKGPVSFISDTWDYFQLLNVVVRRNKDKIIVRDGKLIFRPDSSPKTPLEIICGDLDATINSLEYQGSLNILWDIFGGTINDKGYKVLDSHVGLIYGEAISIQLYEKILNTMEKMGFASSNLVVGIGSFSLQYQTRDTLGQACKSTFVKIAGVDTPIFKDPKTDNSGKKSAKGLLQIWKDGQGEYTLNDNCTWEQEKDSYLEEVYRDGILLRDQCLEDIRINANS